MNRSIAKVQQPPRQGGFTLIELMITLFIAILLTTAALPFYQSFITNQRIKNASFDIMAILTYTRNEAMKRNASVVLTGNASGMVVTVKSDGTVLKRQEPFKGVKVDCMNMAANPHAPISCSATGDFIAEYNNNGRLANAVLPVQLHVMNAGDTTESYFRCVTLAISGIPKSKKGPC